MRVALGAFFVAGAAALLLSSCETMSREECTIADWAGIGYTDGSGGANRFTERERSCARKGIVADFNAYAAGNAEGIRRYCSAPMNGFQRGLYGTPYNGFCPDEFDGAFMEAHAAGHRAFEVRSALNAAESEVSRLESNRRDVDERIRTAEDQLAAATTDDERNRLRNEIGRLNDERRRINDDIRTQNQEVRWRTDAVERVRYEIGDRWGAW